MSLYLSKDEKVMKNWTFASDDTAVGTKDYNLTVTNKRIISTTATPVSINRTELPLSSVKSITGSYSKNSEVQPNPKKGLIIFGILLLVTGLILIFVLMKQPPAIIIGAIMALSGLIMAIYGGSQSKTVTTYAGFKLNITTYGNETSSMVVGKQFSSNETQTISVTHITINEATVYEIIDMLGALVISKAEPDIPQTTEGLYDVVVPTTVATPTLSKEN